MLLMTAWIVQAVVVTKLDFSVVTRPVPEPITTTITSASSTKTTTKTIIKKPKMQRGLNPIAYGAIVPVTDTSMINPAYLATQAEEAMKNMISQGIAEWVKFSNKNTQAGTQKPNPNNFFNKIIPVMMTALYMGGNKIYYHSSMKDNFDGPLFNLNVETIHQEVRDALKACEDDAKLAMGVDETKHRNEANCGDVMAINSYLMERVGVAAPNYQNIRNKALATVSRVLRNPKELNEKGGFSGTEDFEIKVESPCTRSPTMNPDRLFGCKEFLRKFSFLDCQIAWGAEGRPTNAMLSAGGSQSGARKRSIRGSSASISARAGTSTNKSPTGGISKSRKMGVYTVKECSRTQSGTKTPPGNTVTKNVGKETIRNQGNGGVKPIGKI